MHKIHFYKDRSGKEPVFEFLRELSQKKDKNSRIQLNKINDYIEILSRYGTQIGEPYIKYLNGNIWELRPLRSRILFATWYEGWLCVTSYIHEENSENPSKRDRTSKKRICRPYRKGA